MLLRSASAIGQSLASKPRFNLGAEGHVQTIPAVDADDGQSQVNQLLFVEMAPGFVVHLVRHLAQVDSGHGLGPGKGGALAPGVERRLAPRRKQVEPLLRFAQRARIFGMHVQTMRAAVDLGNPGLHQFEQRMLKPALMHISFDAHHRLESVR
jgi:hypothetical protein